MTSELLAIELDAAQEDVKFSRERVRIAEDALAVDVERLEAVQARIEHETSHQKDYLEE